MITENESSLPGDAPLLLFLDHVELGFSLLQLFLFLLNFLQELLTLLQQAFLEDQEQIINPTNLTNERLRKEELHVRKSVEE